MVRVRTSMFVLACLGMFTGNAIACSCQRPERTLTNDEYKVWSFERAVDVVQGRIFDVRAGDDVIREGHHAVIAKMKVTSIVKGNVSADDLTLITGFGTGDCGIPGALLLGIVTDRDLILEVRKVSGLPDLPSEYVVDMCGYADMAPADAPHRRSASSLLD